MCRSKEKMGSTLHNVMMGTLAMSQQQLKALSMFQLFHNECMMPLS